MQRQLGRSGITVSAMGIGTWAIGGLWTSGGGPSGWGEVDDAESVRALQAALDLGITFYDTAANYGAGHAEEIVARAFAGKRDQVVIATKFGYRVDEPAKEVTDYDEEGEVIDRLPADCEASLRRLDTDVIDLYQFHVNEYPVEKAAAVRDALEDLVAAGKIRHYGWSTDHPERARVFAEGAHCVAVQCNMNVIHDAPGILAVCDEQDLACINRGPLGMGLLTGKYAKDTTFGTDDVRSADWVKQDFQGPIMENLEAIRGILTSGGRTLAQGALAWLWARNRHTIPIPGVRTVAQVEENAAAMAFGPLTPAQMEGVDALLGRAS
jgi:aryl-alcohol dehydrogenase-like predicted oxidoreductase